jgi:hypothetical protein
VAEDGVTAMPMHEAHRRLLVAGTLAGLAATLWAGAAGSGVRSAPTSISLSASPGGASCTYSETATPKLKCVNLRGLRIKSGTTITLVAKANAPMPAGWQLYIQKEGPFARNSDVRPQATRKDSYPAPHLCGPTKSASCTVDTTRKVSLTSFNLFRAVVQKDAGASLEADLAIRWCDSSTPGCVG